MLLGTNQCRLQAVRVDALFVVMLLSSLDSVEHVNGKFSWFFSLNIKDVNLILILIIPYSLADFVKREASNEIALVINYAYYAWTRVILYF